MILWSKMFGHDVLDLESATKMGSVDGIVIDKQRIVAVGVSGKLVAASAIRAFDGDVLTFDGSVSSVPDGSIFATDQRGARVIDANGDLLGVVSDLSVSSDGIIETIVLDNHDVVNGNRLVAIGSYAAVVSVS
jgi:sporulation protein YlmC with PRC-barrel domain